MKVCIEQITIEYRYSISPLEVCKENRFWLQGWIDNIAEILEVRDMTIMKYVNEAPILIDNMTIIDIVVQYTDINKI